MAAVASIGSAIRNEILRTLQQDINWVVQPNDRAPAVNPKAIKFSKTRVQINRPGQAANQNLDLPGIIVSKPHRTSVNPNEWTNEADLHRYFFLVQIVDKDEHSDTDRQDTWDKWIEQIIAAFMFNPLPKAEYPYSPTWVLTTATGTQDIDQPEWVRDDGAFITTVEIEVRVAPGAENSRGIIA